jgi:hypothetical protein
VASAVAIGYVVTREGRYELTDKGVERLRCVEGDNAADKARNARA